MTIEEQILRLVKLQDPQNPLAYVNHIVKEYALKKLSQTIQSIDDIVSLDTPRSKMRGNPNASIMIISDRPTSEQFENGEYESLRGTKCLEPLLKVFNHFDVEEDDLFFMDAIYFVPYKEANGERIERLASKTEVDACKTFLFHAIDIVQPKAILLLGPIVSNIFKQEAFTKVRGEWLDVRGIQAIPTHHPASFVYLTDAEDILQEKKDEFVLDIEVLATYSKGGE